jgi:adenosylhomocysteine nucleosidase
MFDVIFVPRGAEESAVRRAAGRERAPVRIVATGIGPHAAARAATGALAAAPARVLVTGLCGLLSPAFVVGDALVYRDIRRDGGRPLALDETLSEAIAARLPGVQTGIHAVDSARVVTSAADKAVLGRQAGAEAVDMESYAIASVMIAAGARVAVARIGSDGACDDLPDLDRALDGSGGLDGFALGLAMLRRPGAGFRLARNATRALRTLERAIRSLLAAVP